MELTQDLKLPKEFTLQQLVLNGIVKTCWGDLILVGAEEERFSLNIFFKTIRLVSHRETVLRSLNETLLSICPKILREKLNDTVIRMQQGYSEALHWEEKFRFILPFTTLNPATAGPYAAKNFMNPEGHFNDLAWAKRFVSDRNQSVRRRFDLACFYCFEKDIVDLWQIRKSRNHHQYTDFLHVDYKYHLSDLVRLWFYHLENKMDELVDENIYYAAGFYVGGLREAIEGGHEYAACFFWAHFSESEKVRFLQELDAVILSTAARRGYARVVHFIYSLLSLEQERILITHRSKYNEQHIWFCLLQSSFYESALNDILTFPDPIPSEVYNYLLNSLAYKIKQLKIPVHKEIFKRLWNHLSKEQKNEVLDTSLILSVLAEFKAIDLLQMIIQPLPHAEKEKMLVSNWQRAGTSVLHQFYAVDDYDAILRYLLFFLIDLNPITHKPSLKVEASNLLDNFINGKSFRDFKKKYTFKSVGHLYKVIQSLQESLQVLHDLLEQVERI